MEANTLLLDGNYTNGPLLKSTSEFDIDVLSPLKKNSQKTKIPKDDFEYDAARDVYICPQGNILKRTEHKHVDKRRDAEYYVYAIGIKICRACPLQDKCLNEKKDRARRIKRYSTDSFLDAHKKKMEIEENRELLKKRKVIVEPVFSFLKSVQRINRFKRFGLNKVRLEFAIYACSYNLRRLKTLLEGGKVGLLPLLFNNFYLYLCIKQQKSSLGYL